jgi:hypothetical protein
MTAFDRDEAAKTYKELPTEELAHIAYVDEAYLAEAKELAVAELDRRGLSGQKEALIAAAHREMETRRQLREDSDNAVHRPKSNTLWDEIIKVVFAVMIWVFAVNIPDEYIRGRGFFDQSRVLLLIVWAALVILAVVDAKHGKRRDLHLFLTVPAVLFVGSLAFRWMFA